MNELPKTYVPSDAEKKWYPYWEKHNFFHAKVNPDKKPYTIVIPPPNITGILTMGHVLNNSIQDVLIRWKRMQGYEALWLPGTDHAGIATQNAVEKSLLKEGRTRHQLGREEFVKRVWKWKEDYGGTIIKQLKRLGSSCDWERERFTMDEGLSNAVQEIFVRLYKKNLIYRGKYIINWCPHDRTAISDDEVNYSEQQGHLWYLRYPFKPTRPDLVSEGRKDSNEYVVVATTRPETMLGDTAVAVHPNDERYKHLVGLTVTLPLANREIPIITDQAVDPTFGTGMVKVTPAHDPNDYWIAERYNASIGLQNRMEPINIFDESARMNENVPERYFGIDRYEARKLVLEDLKQLGYIEKVESYTHNVGRCYRCNTVIEPRLSDQWFVKMKPLAEQALKAVLEGHIRFYPDHWVQTYEHWMVNIRDWCISRQLWWGHRIPVWYCAATPQFSNECKQPIVLKTKPDSCPHCGSRNLKQDEDVLDTWFSSALWPFSTLGWPKDNPELRYFYPTNTLVTGPDIIFFWVARMIMMGLEVMDEIPLPDGQFRTKIEHKVPFHNVYFTSILRDTQGRKMSKSLGNSPDPIDVINEYGTDALRFTILYLAPLGQDVLYSNEKCEIGRNFANKIWNAGRFLLMNKHQLQAESLKTIEPQTFETMLDLADRWILSRLHSTIKELNTSLENFEINQATKILYDFIWHDFCDWYVEIIKSRLYGEEPTTTKLFVLQHAISVFDNALRLLHPFMPFITEELWQHLSQRKEGESIMIASFPIHDSRWIDKKTETEMSFVQDVINGVRNVRGELNVPPSKEISLIIDFPDRLKGEVIKKYQNYFERLARVTAIEQLKNGKRPKHSAAVVVEGGEVFIPLEGIINLEAERQRLQKEVSRVEGLLSGIENKLQNENFVSKAPKEIIEKEQQKLESAKTKLEKLRKNLSDLS